MPMQLSGRNGGGVKEWKPSNRFAAGAVSLHTDQQSLILGEMMTTRNKLQEDNQLLRDKLQDAEMLIRLLELKLRHATGQERVFTRSPAHESAIRAKVESAFDWKSPKKISKRKTKTSRKKTAFVNQVAPGKKTFAAPSSVTESDLAATVSTVSASGGPKGRPGLVEGSISPDPHFRDTVKIRNKNNTRSEPKTKLCCLPNTERREKKGSMFGEEQFPGAADQRRSVVGKLAQVVINEYSNNEDTDGGL